MGKKSLPAAMLTGAQAVHPGYGFLSENADFAELCAGKGVVFIGPPVHAIKVMGSKSAAKQAMQEAQVPLLPGYHENNQDPERLRKAADAVGYPVLLKAVAGGGGKGMRQVHEPSEFDAALASAQREALAGFGSGDMLVEKFLQQPRHVEIQVFCDSHGNGVYLFERDCSVQRRHQKVIEEAPAPNVSAELRARMGDAALKAAQAVSYVGAWYRGISAGSTRQLLLYGDEYSLAGRASGDRNDHWPRFSRVAAQSSGGPDLTFESAAVGYFRS
jgi:3-methylcrotonyl-CoA carboxylase alpha subunit